MLFRIDPNVLLRWSWHKHKIIFHVKVLISFLITDVTKYTMLTSFLFIVTVTHFSNVLDSSLNQGISLNTIIIWITLSLKKNILVTAVSEILGLFPLPLSPAEFFVLIICWSEENCFGFMRNAKVLLLFLCDVSIKILSTK